MLDYLHNMARSAQFESEYDAVKSQALAHIAEQLILLNEHLAVLVPKVIPVSAAPAIKCLECGTVIEEGIAYGYGPTGDNPGRSPFCTSECMNATISREAPDAMV